MDLVAVDVSVVDRNGRPVDDLKPEEFSLKVDGTPRRLVSAEFVSYRSGGAAPPDPRRAFSTNVGRSPGRLIMLVVDENNIRKGSMAPVVRAAKAFVDALGPSDRVGLQLLPSAGPIVDFTWDHALVKRSLDLASGKAVEADRTNRVGVKEAIDIVEHPAPPGLPPPQSTLADVIDRECPGENDATSIARCRSEIENLARTVYSDARARSISTVVAYREVIERLGTTADPKTLVLVTEGVLIEAFADVSWVEERTAAAAVNLFALRLDNPGFDATMARRSPSRSLDRDLLIDGLNLFVGLGRGTVLPLAADPGVTFARLGLELSGVYLLSFEPAPGDRNGRAHDISVSVTRRGVDVRSRREFRLGPSAETPVEDRLVETLRSPLPFADFGVALTAFTFHDTATGRVKILAGAQIDRPADASGPFGVAYRVTDADGTIVAADVDAAVVPVDGARQHFTGSFLADPGLYLIKLAVVDANGRRASIEHSFEAKLTAIGQLRMGDLLLAAPPSPGRAVTPAVDGQIATSTLVGYTELYSEAEPQLARATVTLEIAASDDGTAMATTPMIVRADRASGRRTVEGSLPLSLLAPGDYVARAVLASDGRPIGRVTRPFTIAPAAAGAPPVPAVVAPAVPFASAPESFDVRSALSRPVIAFFLNRLSRPELPAIPEALTPAIGLTRTGRFAEAARLAGTAAADHYVTPFIGGLAHLAAGDLQSAVTSFGASLQAAPSFYPAAFYLGACYAAAGRDADALVAWQQTMVIEPEAPWLLTLVADALVRTGDVERGLTVLRQAEGIWPANGDVQLRLALAAARTGAPAEALAIVDRWLTGHPDDTAHLFAAMRILHDTRAAGRATVSVEADRTSFTRYYDAYVRLPGANADAARAMKRVMDREPPSGDMGSKVSMDLHELHGDRRTIGGRPKAAARHPQNTNLTKNRAERADWNAFALL